MNEPILNKYAHLENHQIRCGDKMKNGLGASSDSKIDNIEQSIKELTLAIQGNKPPNGGGARFFGYSPAHFIIAICIVIVFGGGIAYVAVQNHLIGLIHTYAPYTKDKAGIDKHIQTSEYEQEKADEERGTINQKLVRIETKLDILINSAKTKK